MISMQDLAPYIISFGQTALGFILLITTLVFCHELGHFWVARKMGVRVESFSIGFGKALIKWNDKKGTQWRLGWIPMGGYVKMYGDNDAASTPDINALNLMSDTEKKHSFYFQSLWKRALIIFAGPMANYLLAIAIFTGFNLIYGIDIVSTEVTSIVEQMPAPIAGIAKGDRITAINGQKVNDFQEIKMAISISNNAPIAFTIKRDQEEIIIQVQPKIVEIEDQTYGKINIPAIGVGFENYSHNELNILTSALYAVKQSYSISVGIFEAIKQIITGRRGFEEFSGPLKIAQYSGKSIKTGVAMLLRLIAMISLNLGLINLLPIPLLDGGHLFMYAIEAVYGKPIPNKIQQVGFRIGFILLIGLMIISTWNDIKSFFKQ